MHPLLGLLLLAAPPAPSVVLRHAVVMPASRPAIPDGAVVMQGGKIVAVGPSASVATPAGGTEVDLTGKVVTPGIIDAHSHLGVYAAPSSIATDDGNEATNPVTAEVSAESAFWPQDPQLQRAVAGGVTSALILPGSANLIGGRGFPIKLKFGTTAAAFRFPGAKDVLKIACGENPKRVYGKKSGPSTRMGNVAGYRIAFAQAKDYAAKWDEYRDKLKADPKKAGLPPPRDLKLETLAEVLAGKVNPQIHCYRADEMDQMLRIADEFGFKVRAFHHAVEAYKVRDTLKARDVAVATWADWWGFKLEANDAIPENAGMLTRAGVRVAIHSDSPVGGQRLNQEAAKALARAREAGMALSDEEALRWVTLNPAWILGVSEVTGSLDVGKMADVVVWDRSPFSTYARVVTTYVDGEVVFDSLAGPATASDFEIGTPGADGARLTARPAAIPALPSCDGNASGCARPLPETDGGCFALTDAVALIGGEPRQHATVVIQGGRVHSVGGEVPAGCARIDTGGRVLTPGLIDPESALGLVEVTLEESSSDVSPRGEAGKEPVHAALQAAESVNPRSTLFPVARGGGVTSAVVAPEGLLAEDAAPVLISGQGAWVDGEGRVLRTPASLQVHLGQVAHDALSLPRAAALERLRALFDDARFLQRNRKGFDENRSRALAAPARELEALVPVLEGKVPLVVRANRADDLLAAVKLSQSFKLKLVLAGAAEGHLVARELAAARVPVIVRPTGNLPASFDERAARADNAALLAAAGVRVLISTEADPHFARGLAQEAGNAVAWGLPYAQALQAITVNPAQAFGLPTGQLAPGARADLVLWSGDPLEVMSHPVAVWIGGTRASLSSHQSALYEKYRGK